MNKKVSTIFAMAALMGGVFSGSAYAVELSSFPANSNPIAASAFNNGTQVVLSQQVGGQTLLLGYEKTGSNPSAVSVIDAASPIEDTDVLNYAWRVFVHRNTANTQNVYSFINVATGDTLSFDTTGAVRITDRSNEVYATDSNGRYNFTWGTGTPSEYNGAAAVMNAEGVGIGSFALSLTPESVSLNGSANTILSALTSASVPDEDLNTLYNGKGFNLGAQPIPDIPGAVEDNLFGGESQIWAYDVNEPAGYYVVGTASNGDELRIPNGKYFFSNVIFKGGRGASDFMPPASLAADNINWLVSTLIAVSPTEISETTDATRANGEGFKLVEVKGSDFIFDQNTSIPEGDDISIFNACFTVETDYTAQANYPYALSLGTFYYQRSAQFAGTDDQSSSNEVYLGVSSYSNSNQRVVSKADTPEHVFNLNSSSVVDGRTLLNDTPTPAVYTIQFVDGTSGDRNLMDKYLTVGANEQGTAFQWEAKGAALANLDYPIFQYVITSARPASDRYINVTFTNRETGQNFTAQLFPEGENLYSLAISNESVTGTAAMEVQPYTVNTPGSNTYDVETLGNPLDLDSDITVRLQKVENVDNYAGFLNVDNEEIRTLAFARDVNDTSNKLYALVDAAVDGDGTGTGELEHDYDRFGNIYDILTDDNYSAAQWQLIKSASPLSISRVIVYHNTTTNSVDDVANGDRINAYVYGLRYVEDGTATNLFLSNSYPTGTPGNDERDLQSVSASVIDNLRNTISNRTGIQGDINFIIKENVDGSVSLIKRDGAMVTSPTTNSGEATYVAANTASKAIELDGNYEFNEYVYATVPDITNGQYEIKTYLDPQPVEISWPAKEGHVTIESELGNYITMNEDRDAIVVNENEADDYYLYVTDKNAVVPSFYITKGVAAANGERMFMFNPADSVSYYVASGDYDRQYQWAENATKVMFKAATINDTRDTLTINVKGETKYIAKEADDDNADIWGGIKRFKFQIVETGDEDGHYYIRQANATDNNGHGAGVAGNYLSALNEKVTWSQKSRAMIFTVAETSAPTANESVSATEVKVIATDGAVNIKNAAGKNVVISTILGQIVANEVLTSDNATISVPAGIAIVSVDGEEAVKVSVR